jgi:hypothetical protein
MMVLPRYSLRQLLAAMGASSFFFLVAAMAVRGHPWAAAITIGILVVAGMLLVQGGFFFAAWLFANVTAAARFMPQSVKLACVTAIGSSFLSILDLALENAGVTKSSTPVPAAVAASIGMLINVTLLALIVNRHNWARWVYVALTGLGIPIGMVLMVLEFFIDPLGAVLAVGQVLLALVSIGLLMTPSTRRWFAEGSVPEQLGMSGG